MKKTILTILIITMLVVSLSACQNTTHDTLENETDLSSDSLMVSGDNIINNDQPPATTENVHTEMPEPFGNSLGETGGDGSTIYYQPCNWKLDNIPLELLKLASQEKRNAWYEEKSIFVNAPSSLTDYVNVYSFIDKFGISDEDVRSAYSLYLESDDPQIAISEEDLDIILSKDEKRIIDHFASEYSIVIGDKIYSPQWIYEHSSTDYEQVGITPIMIEEKTDLYRKIKFSNEAANALKAKLSSYVGSEVQLATINYSDTQLFADFSNIFITVNDKVFDVSWLSSHAIQDYATEGITISDVQYIMNEMSEYSYTYEYEWIYSCLVRMQEDAGLISINE